MSQCNYCNFKQIERIADTQGMVVTLKPGWMGGIDVFVHPKNVVIEKGAGEEGHPQHQYKYSWMMMISSSCCCDDDYVDWDDYYDDDQ